MSDSLTSTTGPFSHDNAVNLKATYTTLATRLRTSIINLPVKRSIVKYKMIFLMSSGSSLQVSVE